MNAAINSDVLGNATAVNPLDLPGLEQVFITQLLLKLLMSLRLQNLIQMSLVAAINIVLLKIFKKH